MTKGIICDVYVNGRAIISRHIVFVDIKDITFHDVLRKIQDEFPEKEIHGQLSTVQLATQSNNAH